jgi:SAM-dependent methyltransferase
MERSNFYKGEEDMIDVEQILRSVTRPTPFEKVGRSIWTDEHVAKQLLAAHLDPHTDAASRRPETIDKIVTWIMDKIRLKPGMSILDLGCGPGLYSQRFAKAGMKVTGVDFSEISVSYARVQASAENLLIDYRLQNYLQFDGKDCFDATLLIYGDYCALSPEDRQQLLGIVQHSLKNGGRFILDVTTRECRKRLGLRKNWYASLGGFWSAKRHLVLEQGFDYPDELIYLDQFIVIDEDDGVRVFRNWFQDFNPDSIRKELEIGGFHVLDLYADLLGNPLSEDSEWIGIIAERT